MRVRSSRTAKNKESCRKRERGRERKNIWRKGDLNKVMWGRGRDWVGDDAPT